MFFCRNAKTQQAVICSRDDQAFFIGTTLIVVGTLQEETGTEHLLCGNTGRNRTVVVIFKKCTELRGAAIFICDALQVVERTGFLIVHVRAAVGAHSPRIRPRR